MSGTLTEKIFAKKSGRTSVSAGDNVWINVDVLMTHDVCGPGTIGVFKREFGEKARVWNPDAILLIPDHYIFTSDSKSNRNVDILRDFAREQGIKYFYDVIDDPNGQWHFDKEKGPLKRQYGKNFAGVCHTAMPERGHVRPGEILLGTDSHTCMAGAFSEFATGIGNTDAGFVMGTGKLLLRTPQTLRFIFEGELKPGVMAKDIILHIIGMIGFDGATYKAMEYGGDGASRLNMDDRMTIANMAIEAGGKNGIFPFDSVTAEFVDASCLRNGTKAIYEPVEQDLSAQVEAEYLINLSELEPVVALHPNPGNRKLARDCKDIKLDRAYIGSCTGGKTSDFLAFANIIKGQKVKIPTFGVPATPTVLGELQQTIWDGRSVWQIMADAGVTLSENASCAACLGGPEDTFGRMNTPMTCISATNRNFPGRMGHIDSRVILASPMTVAASALTGYVTDPRG